MGSDFGVGLGSFMSSFAKGQALRRDMEEREQLRTLRDEQNERERLRLQRDIQRQDEMRPGELEVQKQTIDNLKTSGQNAREAGERERQEQARQDKLRQAQNDAEAQGAASRQEAIKANIGKSIFEIEEQGPVLDNSNRKGVLPLHYGAPGTDKTYLNIDALRGDPGVRKRAEGMSNSIYTYITGDHVDKVVAAAQQAGNMELAKAYPIWIKDQRVQAGVKHFTSAIGRWDVGDVGGALDSLEAAYNARDYFDDNFSVKILAKNRDKNTGNIASVDVQFTNDRTGDVMKTQRYTPQELFNTSVHFLAPDKLAEYGVGQVKAEREARAKIAEEQRGLQNDLEKERQKTELKRQEAANGSNPYATGAFNEGQGKAATFGDRMAASNEVINRLEGINTGADGWFGGVLNNNLPAAVGNQIASTDRQRFNQAKLDFASALLRKESGAAVTLAEINHVDVQYFPQPGDGPEVIAQKRRNRVAAMQGIMREAGPSYRPPQPGGAAGASGSWGAQGAVTPQADVGGGMTGRLNANATQQSLTNARAAIARGADPTAIMRRLQENGIDPRGL